MDFVSLRDAFMGVAGNSYEFPTAFGTPLFLKEEDEFVQFLNIYQDKPDLMFRMLTMDLSDVGCYDLVILGLRVILHSARHGSLASFRTGVQLLVAGAPRIDWRDVLGALRVAESCSNRLGIDLQTELKAQLDRVSEKAFVSLVESYFQRTPNWRSLHTFGLEQVSDGKELQFKAIVFGV